jgi:hypothetical protein
MSYCGSSTTLAPYASVMVKSTMCATLSILVLGMSAVKADSVDFLAQGYYHVTYE